MIKKVFAIYDSKAEAYLNPIMFGSLGEAVRAFSDEVNNPQSMLNKHAEDYVLFYIADYDDETAKYTNASACKSLGVGIEFIKPKLEVINNVAK